MMPLLAQRGLSREQINRDCRATWLFLGIGLTALVAAIGCDDGRIARYHLKGQITYDGQPVPAGHLRFEPDRAQGNSGPGSYAAIVDGKYETTIGRGTISGPHTVYIFGTDGVEFKNRFGAVIPIGRPLFPEYQVSVDLPKDAADQDFVVPTDSPGRRKKRARR